MEIRWPATTLVDALRQVFDRYGGPSESCSDVEVMAQPADIVVAFCWERDIHRFAIRLPLDDLEEGMQTGEPLGSPAEWVREVVGWLQEELDTGYVSRASRTLVDDRIELSRPTWPSDRRCYLSGAGPESEVWQGRLRRCEREGLSSAAAQEAATGGRLISWVTSQLNAMSGGPVVGQAVVARLDDDTAELIVCEALAGAPESVAFDVARAALTASADAGVAHVRTAIQMPMLEILGFRRQPDGSMVVDTSLLDADLAKAEEFITQAQSQPIPADWVRRASELPVSRVYAGPLAADRRPGRARPD